MALMIGIILAELGVLLWVLLRRRGMWPVLVVNIVFGGAVLYVVVPYFPAESMYIWRGRAAELFDYKNSILTLTEAVVMGTSLLAFRGIRAARVVASIGFAFNFVLSLFALEFVLTFSFKCCGYL